MGTYEQSGRRLVKGSVFQLKPSASYGVSKNAKYVIIGRTLTKRLIAVRIVSSRKAEDAGLLSVGVFMNETTVDHNAETLYPMFIDRRDVGRVVGIVRDKHLERIRQDVLQNMQAAIGKSLVEVSQ
ncbi:MAG: hypothetical protein ACX94C_07685 [Phycisphaerales bacterium]